MFVFVCYLNQRYLRHESFFYFTQMKPELMMLTKKLEPSWKQRGSLQSGIHDIKAPHIPILKWKTTLVLSNVQRISCLVEINQKLFISPRPQGISPALIQKQKPESPRLKKQSIIIFFLARHVQLGVTCLRARRASMNPAPLKQLFRKHTEWKTHAT